MIHNTKVIAFTPAGRKRYMEILLKYIQRDHARGVIDEWILFNNAYKRADEDYVRSLACDWIRVVDVDTGVRDAFNIHAFYKYLDDKSAIYLRFDDDIVYVHPRTSEYLARQQILLRQEMPGGGPFLVYPTIIGNTRMGFWMQDAGNLPEKEWGKIENEIFDTTAFTKPEYILKLQRKAIAAIRADDAEASKGVLIREFGIGTRLLSTTDFTDSTFVKRSSPEGHVSVNSFAIRGEDMYEVDRDEERSLSLYEPGRLGRPNMILGSAIVVHFAYHTQTEAMEKSGMLADYKQIADSITA